MIRNAQESATMRSDGQFTGLHMLAAMLAFFAVVIGVNVTLAMFAGSSWTGLVVENSYVASQQFNARAAEGRAQAALGWSSTLTISDGRVGYRLADRRGKAISLAVGTATFRHPAYAADDVTLALSPQPDGALGAAQAIRDGVWIVEFHADAGLDRPYRETRRLVIRAGAMQ
jgi:nitrogen fixation protein FixH